METPQKFDDLFQKQKERIVNEYKEKLRSKLQEVIDRDHSILNMKSDDYLKQYFDRMGIFMPIQQQSTQIVQMSDKCVQCGKGYLKKESNLEILSAENDIEESSSMLKDDNEFYNEGGYQSDDERVGVGNMTLHTPTFNILSEDRAEDDDIQMRQERHTGFSFPRNYILSAQENQF
ncbi:hypothetical protein FGO68_gene12098 [Halteria grandinella]|uniref:Uncharacterized protein n=1 Tax=Halteria grandinella TaxID=5974 RepID=A0A8J8NBM3_HALGN|nr:hypothetical protein FGO68_gene12098 [Halteria grandinella]